MSYLKLFIYYSNSLAYIKYTDINLFHIKNIKADNDKINKKREEILYSIGKNKLPNEWYEKSILWNNLNINFNEIVKKTSDYNYNNYNIILQGGKKNNYDFDIIYYNKLNEILDTKKIEFKYNCKNITKYPQFLSISSKNFIKDRGYAEYFYDNSLNKIVELSKNITSIPSKKDYLKYIHTTNYNNHNLFKELKENEHNFKIEKKCIVDNSISNYINNELILDINSINNLLKNKQQNKHYILYYNGLFYNDYIKNEELEVINIEKIKNNNTLVLSTNTKSKINMLLRWKNRAGILYPAWQISLKRDENDKN